MAPEKPRKEQEEEEDELMLEDGGIEESPRRSFEDCGDSDEEDDDNDEERDGDGVGSPRSFQSHKWPQSYRCVRCSPIHCWIAAYVCDLVLVMSNRLLSAICSVYYFY
jgi:hypothetical protein